MVVEDAFAVLRDAGLSPGAREALNAILSHVMDDLDRSGQQWSQRLRYSALMDSLGGSRASSVEPVTFTPVAERTAVRPSQMPDLPSKPMEMPPTVQSSSDIAQAVMEAMRLSSIRPEAHKPLTSFVEDYLVGLRKKGRGEQCLNEIGTKVRIFACTVGDKPVHEYSKTDLLDYRDLIDEMPLDAIKHLKTDDPAAAIALNKKRAVPLQKSVAGAEAVRILGGRVAGRAARGTQPQDHQWP